MSNCHARCLEPPKGLSCYPEMQEGRVVEYRNKPGQSRLSGEKVPKRRVGDKWHRK